MNNIAYLHRSALETLTIEANTCVPLETGGILMGHFKQPENIPVIMLATQPGPQAVHLKYYYQPDYVYDELLIAEVYKKSNRKITYLGDWHTHPGLSSRMSYRDKKTLRRIMAYKPARLSTPMMLILSLDDEWVPTVWQGNLYKKKLFGNRFRVEKRTVQMIG